VDKFERELFSEELKPRLWRRCFALTTDEETAKDLMQDTYLKAMENKEKFDGKHIDRWVLTICRNKFLDNQRKKKEYLLGDDIREIATSGDENLESVKRDLLYCMEKLETIERELMSMIIDSNYRHIAEELDLSLANTRVKVHRAREKLGKCMGIVQ
jgi:RNA polymerase sigma-70 factor (ECF subfamily)